jgi:peptidoglycan/xylan/chitin deacetylase (PgdA/CDA1 family)
MVIAKPGGGIFEVGRDLCKEMSTNSNDNAGCGSKAAMGDCVAQGSGWLSALGFELAYFSGYARLRPRTRGGAGVILRFQRVRPARADAFQPLRSDEITPQFLHQVIRRLKRWDIDIVGMDEACRRAAQPRGRRFVAMTFDGGTCDFVDYAYPLLSAHQVPFTIYLAGALADGRGEMWWLALERIIAGHSRVSLIIDGRQRHFETPTAADKTRAYYYLDSWLRTLPPSALTVAVHDLCTRYSVKLAALAAEAALTWEQVATFAADPLATFGCSTAGLARLANLDDATAQREIATGRAVVRSALPREVNHFAYPFGDAASFDRRHAAMVAAAGFTSGVGALPGVVQPDARSDPYALPRLSWDGRRRSLRALRVMMWGGISP